MSSNGNGSNGDKPKRGRPQKDVDTKLVYKLACIGCTYDEIAAITGLAKSTLNEHPRFSERIKKGHERMKRSLRRAQLKRALEGSDTMLIWLGKNCLNQTDKSTTTVEGEIKLTAETLFNAFHKRGQFAAVDGNGN